MRMLYVAIFGVSAISVAQGTELYTITDLGPGSPIAVNNQGVVLAQGSQGTFLYEGGQTQYLPQPQGGNFGARAINDLGEVVGTTNFGSGYQYYLSTYLNGALTVNTALPNLDPVAINNAGQITGVEVSKYDSFLYSGGTLTTIPNQPNVGEPVARPGHEFKRRHHRRVLSFCLRFTAVVRVRQRSVHAFGNTGDLRDGRQH